MPNKININLLEDEFDNIDKGKFTEWFKNFDELCMSHPKTNVKIKIDNSYQKSVPTDWLVTHQLSETDFVYQIIFGEETFQSGFTILKNSIKTFSYQEKEMAYPPETFISIRDGKINWELSIINHPDFENKTEHKILDLLDPCNFENKIYFKWVYKNDWYPNFEKSYVSVCGLFHLDTPQEFLETYGLNKLKQIQGITHTTDMTRIPIKDVIHYLKNIPYQTYQKKHDAFFTKR